ncbi:hypothetical protein QO001_002191 [Methylobacterium brachiatum]|uniref:Uncharacterized protein n=1 Tax=Methylobacterium brachiatum TaxID=269660 RepID=A0AAJ1WW14_9HYPH|nr:hypothetical protein [Methylobacterium brachiatum]MCB4802639.1 hypothetical protein [Methylobacterium brachiatum]MDQ0543265.1 hypothetical protein [Methylobacterium brachiatum]
MQSSRTIVLSILATSCLAGCGAVTPLKDPIIPNDIDARGHSREGKLKTRLISKVKCEVQNALFDAEKLGSVPWLKYWGTQITIKSTWEDKSSLSPSITNDILLKGVESISNVFGATGNAQATRLETTTFIWQNSELLDDQYKNISLGVNTDCDRILDGPLVESDHRIREFIYDNATVAAYGVATTGNFKKPPFTVLQSDLTFVGSIGANYTPIWRFTKLSANTGGSLLSGTRTITGQIIMTVGPLAPLSKIDALKAVEALAEPAASQHNAAVIGSFVAAQNAARFQ